MKFVLVLMLLPGLVFAENLSDKLNAELNESGQTHFTDLEIALIGSGVESAESLEAYKGKFQALLDKLALTDKQQRLKGSKKVKALHKMLFTQLASEGGEADGLLELLDNNTHTTLSASYVLAALARREGVGGNDFEGLKDGVDGKMLQAIDERTMSAAFFIPKAYSMEDAQAAEIYKFMNIARKLAPSSTFGVGRYDVQFYNRVLLLHNEGDQVPAAYIGAAAASFYPSRTEFAALCLNIGIKMFQSVGKDGNMEQALDLGAKLSEVVGTYKADFEKVMGTMYYNQSVMLYNSGKFEEALAMLAKSNPEEPGYETVEIGALEKMIQAAVDKNDMDSVNALMARLDAVKPERGERMRTRMAQMRLKALDEAGKYDEAIELALTDTTSEIGKNNYIAVLTKFIQNQRAGGIKETLEYLDTKIPTEMRDNETVRGLRFNTYVAWLEQYKDDQYKDLIPIYKKALADEKLKLSEKDRQALMDGYGNALYREVEYLVAEREFKKADAKSKAAIRELPNHANLLKQRQLVETILRRVSEN